MSYHQGVIRGYGCDPFAAAYCDTRADAARLALDIAAVAFEIAAREDYPSDEPPYYAAAREHCRRIGGIGNLRSYLDVLRVGAPP